jgi:hypothetical protein
MNRFTRVRRALVVGLAAAAATLSMTQVAHADPPGPNLPPGTENIAVDAAQNQVFLVGHAKGVQIYTCNSEGKWGPGSTPRADLVDDKGKLVATHFGGPTWQALDGSTVKGSLPPTVATKSPDGAIPWLRLAATAQAKGPKGGDEFVKTTFIQRVNTSGGVAPTTSCTTADKPVEVEYTADYYFWMAAKPGA